MAEQAVVSGLEELVISLDGADQETYETYRVGGSLDKVIENIKSLIKQREAYQSPFPLLTIRVLLNRYNENQLPAIRRPGKQLRVDNVVVAPIMVNTDSREDMERWLPVNERHSFYDYQTRQDRTLQKVKACPYLWESCVISWEGAEFTQNSRRIHATFTRKTFNLCYTGITVVWLRPQTYFC